MPEAYLLLEPYSTTRPGLLVLDADGRHVDSIDLAIAGGLTADDVARRLIAAKKAPGVERLRVKTTDAQGEEREAVAAALRAMKGVRAVSEADGGLRVETDVAAVDPAAVVVLLAKAGPHATLEEPVLVTLEPRPGKTAEHVKALLAVPGNWRSGPVGSVSVWMTRLLVHPDPLRDAGWTSDLVAERFTFASLPKGGSAVTVLRAPEKVPGALAVIPDVFRDAITVVGRAAMDLEKVRDAFRAAGADPLPAAK